MAKITDEYGNRVPFSLEAEQAVLGSILISPASFDVLPAIIEEQDFYLEQHRIIYVCMRELFMSSRNIDIVTLEQKLLNEGVDDIEGIKKYLRVLIESVPTASNVRDYAKIVAGKSKLRQLIEACDEIKDEAYSEADEPGKIIGHAEQMIFDLAQGSVKRDFVHIKDLLKIVTKQVEINFKNGGQTAGIDTGYSDLDRKLVGMEAGNLILIGARPGVGKTSFALNIATSVSKATGTNVCIFTLEMSAEELTSRILSSEAMVDSTKMREGKLSKDDWKKIAETTADLSRCNIYIDDTTNITVTGMKAKLRRMKNVGLVVVDYLGLMQSDRKKLDNRNQEVADITRNLKIMAKDFGIPIIACAQLNRESDTAHRRPTLANLRDSGAIEQDADVVVFLYKDGGSADENNTIEVIVAKNRHGQTGTVYMGWMAQYTRFVGLSQREQEDAQRNAEEREKRDNFKKS